MPNEDDGKVHGRVQTDPVRQPLYPGGTPAEGGLLVILALALIPVPSQNEYGRRPDYKEADPWPPDSGPRRQRLAEERSDVGGEAQHQTDQRQSQKWREQPPHGSRASTAERTG